MPWKVLKIAGCLLAGGACVALAIFIPPLGVIGAGFAATAFTVSLSAVGGVIGIGGTAYFVSQGAAPPDPNPADPAVAAAAGQANNIGNQVALDVQQHVTEFTQTLQARLATLEAELEANRGQTAQLIISFNAEREQLVAQLNRIESTQREMLDGMRGAGLFATRRGPQGGRAPAANQPEERAAAAGVAEFN